MMVMSGDGGGTRVVISSYSCSGIVDENPASVNKFR